MPPPPLSHDLIVIGGSAGSVEALTALVAGLPADLPAAVCVVVHHPPYLRSNLARILERAGPLRAVDAVQGAPLERGTIHVAVPDRHLLVERDPDAPPDTLGTIRLAHGPRENRARPAVDPLFRSAALTHGPRVVGVVLSGALDDGTAGLWAVCDRGGMAVVQDPDDALVASMPTSAIDEVGANHVAPASALGPLLGQLARTLVDPVVQARVAGDDRSGRSAELAREVAITSVDEEAHQRPERYGTPSRFPCPECGGVLWTVSRQGPLRFRCETGHAYSPANLAESQQEGVEHAMWAALRALEDRIALADHRASDAAGRGMRWLAERYQTQADASQEHAAVIRAVLRMNGRQGLRPARPSDAAAPSGADVQGIDVQGIEAQGADVRGS